jgi:FtsP/CotA-like multicopper oxidase with cupredoxin domain
MPTLTFTEGDVAEIYVHNELNEDTSLHWHGLFCLIKKMVFQILLKCPSSRVQHKYTFNYSARNPLVP